jgi:glycosyltransferase involved in cell wall biosynthesis
LAEAVSDGINGLIVPPDDPLALADAVARFYRDDLGETLAAGVASQADRFSWPRSVRVVEELASS